MKKLILILLTVLAIPALHIGYLYTHREFTPHDFRYAFVSRLEGRADPEERAFAASILSQPFTYLGYGKQMTAYESADHRYVIKFFNPRQVIKKEWFSKFSKWRRLSSMKWISEAYLRREARLRRLFARYQEGFYALREESGLVYVHLNRSTAIPQSIQLIDKEGESCTLDLEEVPFVIQEKAVIASKYLKRLVAEGKTEQAQALVISLKQLFIARAEKGFTDRIQTLHNNYGFVGERAVQIDLGRLTRDHALMEGFSEEITRVLSNLHQSLEEISPVLVE